MSKPSPNGTTDLHFSGTRGVSSQEIDNPVIGSENHFDTPKNQVFTTSLGEVDEGACENEQSSAQEDSFEINIPDPSAAPFNSVRREKNRKGRIICLVAGAVVFVAIGLGLGIVLSIAIDSKNDVIVVRNEDRPIHHPEYGDPFNHQMVDSEQKVSSQPSSRRVPESPVEDDQTFPTLSKEKPNTLVKDPDTQLDSNSLAVTTIPSQREKDAELVVENQPKAAEAENLEQFTENAESSESEMLQENTEQEEAQQEEAQQEEAQQEEAQQEEAQQEEAQQEVVPSEDPPQEERRNIFQRIFDRVVNFF